MVQAMAPGTLTAQVTDIMAVATGGKTAVPRLLDAAATGVTRPVQEFLLSLSTIRGPIRVGASACAAPGLGSPA